MPKEMIQDALKERGEWLHAFYAREEDVQTDFFGEFIVSKYEDGVERAIRLPWHLSLSIIYKGCVETEDRINYPSSVFETVES